jgi:1-deoxy-D-xylulose 5-phosphate reductoisomerase
MIASKTSVMAKISNPDIKTPVIHPAATPTAVR